MTHFTKPAAEPADQVSTPGPDTPSVPMCFSAPQSPDELGQLGRYRILSRLGAGGMGAVYLAFDTGLERTVALKIMLRQHATNVQARERFLREARAAAMVRSDNVVTIFDVGEAEGTPFIAMEHLRGYPLDEYLKKKGEVNLGQALRVARETAVGLEAAHKLGLVHRDIKPANLWLEAPKGRLKILDFGLARKDVADTDLTLTQEGQMLGSPAFMSPEQGRGEKVDHRSDLFSLGVLLRPLAWLEARDVRVVGDVWLDLEEQGAVGWAAVESVLPCPEVEGGDGGLVTGRFRHDGAGVWELTVEGESMPIGVTAQHPVWSADRGRWVPACELHVGERLEGLLGEAKVAGLRWTGRVEPVYNIEVDGDHCYRVGHQGLLVRNISEADLLAQGKTNCSQKKPEMLPKVS